MNVNLKELSNERLAEWYAGTGSVMKAKLSSTCQKRTVVCVLLDKDNKVVACESNRCSPKGTCAQLLMTTSKENYPPNVCNSEHAEVRAMKLAKRLPKTAIMFGHSFFCDDCENFLRGMGVVNLIAGGMLDA